MNQQKKRWVWMPIVVACALFPLLSRSTDEAPVALKLDPSLNILNYGVVNLGESKQIALRIRNVSNGPVDYRMTVPKGFQVYASAAVHRSGHLAAGNERWLGVKFTPTNLARIDKYLVFTVRESGVWRRDAVVRLVGRGAPERVNLEGWWDATDGLGARILFTEKGADQKNSYTFIFHGGRWHEDLEASGQGTYNVADKAFRGTYDVTEGAVVDHGTMYYDLIEGTGGKRDRLVGYHLSNMFGKLKQDWTRRQQ
ncbi:MAG: hypothetical protein AB1714_14180 [Acidobacteriota bacterium]